MDTLGAETLRSNIERETFEKVRGFIMEHSDLSGGLIDVMLADCNEPFHLEILDYLEDESEPKDLGKVKQALVFVHLTDHFPEDQTILPRYNVAKQGTEVASKYRTTTHGSLSFAVTSHAFGSWLGKKFAVLVPFENVAGDIVGYRFDDLYTAGPVAIGDSAVICRLDGDGRDGEGDTGEEGSSALSQKGAILDMVRSGVIDRETIRDIVVNQLVPDISPKELIQKAIRPDWSVDIFYLSENLPDSHWLKKEIVSLESLHVSRSIETPVHYLVAREMLHMGRLPMFLRISGDLSENVFLGDIPYDKQESPIKHSGCNRFLNRHYNESISAMYRSEGERRYGHIGSVWSDIEKIWDLVAGFLKNADVTHPLVLTEMTREVAEKQLLSDRVAAALRLVSPGGKLWIEVLKKSRRSPRVLLFAYHVLFDMKADLEKLLKEG